MPSRVLNRLALAAYALAGLVLLLGLAACGDDDPTACDLYEVGVLEGRVTSAGEPLAVEVGAEPSRDNPTRSNMIWTTADSNGFYRLELPTGLHEILVRDPAVQPYRDNQRDTVRVEPEIRRHDLARGRLELDFMMPAELEGEEINLQLESPLGGWVDSSARVVGGRMAATFLALVPGDFRIELRSSRIGRTYLPGTPDRRQADLFTVGATEPVRVVRDFRPTAGVLRGTVTGASQHVSSLVHVAALTDPYNKAGETYCADDGSFAIPVLFPGPVRLSLTGSGFTRWVGGTDYLSATEFDLQPGQELTGLSFPDAGLRIRLRGPGDRIIYHSEVRLLDEAGNEWTAYGGSSNPISIYNLDPGRYRIQVFGNCRDADWAPQWYGGSETLAGAVPVDLAAAEPPTLVFDLVEGGRIRGGVLIPAGGFDPVKGYELYDATGERICAQGTSGDDRMHLQGLADGTYHVAAAVTYHDTWYYPGTWDLAEATPVVIEDHAVIEDLVWPLPDIIPGGK